jgi:hypothetical protein
MKSRTKARQVVSIMQRAATLPIVRQRLDGIVALDEGETWVARAEAKVGEQPADVVITNQRLILLSEGATVAALPHAEINFVSKDSQTDGLHLTLLSDLVSPGVEMIVSTYEQAEALLELIAEARGTWPIESIFVGLKEPGSSEITVSVGHPHVKFAKVDRETVYGSIQIKFPDQCAWCSNPATATRRVELYLQNPLYTGRAARAVQTMAAWTLEAATETGDNVLKVANWQKVKGVVLDMMVPHCADHADTSSDSVLSITSHGMIVGDPTCPIKVRDADYAYAIARANLPEPRPWEAPSPLVRRMEAEDVPPTEANEIRVPVLDGLIWPDRCIVCGVSSPGERYHAPVMMDNKAEEGQGLDVPICAADQKKARNAQLTCGGVLVSGLVIAAVLGWLTVVLLRGLQSGFLRGLAAVLVGAAGYGLWSWGLFQLAKRRWGTSAVLWFPLKIEREVGHYLLKFENPEMAEVVREVNGLSETA